MDTVAGCVWLTGANLSAMSDTASTAGTLLERMGIEVTRVTAERAEGRMPVAGNTQPFGLLHGGASAVLAETLASFAAQRHAGEGRTTVGIELNATHHRSAREGWVHAVATAVHLGRSLATYEVTVDDDGGRRLCTARVTCMLIDIRD
ncbi:hypothetical protein CELD12_16180 [Cellulomonas sp. NTE-D12]|nr:hypothetical protein CELD12_16180 [Cellulomonas sp. NTE-D12]